MVENKTIDICDELGQNFIDFSYEANSARAFADARDGLKPGQRASLWEMFHSGYLSNKKHVKSAKIDGAVAGNWWPHGNVAIYETFARMSQPWINNIPEVDWHGNNGSQYTGPECASDRYTEARLSKAAEEGFFQGIKKNNVPMIWNFSEDEQWPEVLPAIFPRLMVNGCQGIGSTIANVWLPHTLEDVSNILIKYMETKTIDTKNIYPSFPTGGIIINKDEVHTIYETGKGKAIVRGKAEIKGNKILITELPYQVYVQPYVEKITEMAIKEELIGIESVSNKSGKDILLIEIECAGDPNRVLNQLYSKTDLQKNYNANQWALVGKTPKLLTLKEYCEIYLKHNLECLVKELTFDLNKANARLEIVNGLLIALEDIDNIIQKIKNSESAAKAKITLMTDYKMTENQAKAVLDMKLSKLAKLEKVEIQKEKEELLKTIEDLKKKINSEPLQIEVIKGRLTDLTRKYKSPRKTQLDQINIVKEDKETAAVVPEECVVIMSQTGDIKRIPKINFRIQRKGGKGVKTADEATMAAISTNTIDHILAFSNLGKMYKILVDNIPAGTTSTKGQNISGLINLEYGEKIITITNLNKEKQAPYVVFFTKNGMVKKTAFEEYKSAKKSTGIQAIKLKEGDSIVDVKFLDKEEIMLFTKGGMCIRFNSDTINPIGKLTIGVKGINLNDGDEVIAAVALKEDVTYIGVISTLGLGKKMSLSEFTTQGKGGKGVFFLKPSDVIGEVAGVCGIRDEDNLLLICKNSSICVSAQDLPLLGRAATGSTITKSKTVSSVIKL